MCILFIHTNPSPSKGGYRLIVASNRDEYYNRPAKNLFECQDTSIIGGRDVTEGHEGGMWLGVSTKGGKIKFGALLNVLGEERKLTTPGRGPLVYNYLESNEPAVDYVQTLQPNNYNAFNLIMAEINKNESSTYLYSNSPEATYNYQGKQTLSFGNSTPDVPFTKVKNGKIEFEKIIAQTNDKNLLIEKLLDMLKCEDLHLPDPEIERRNPAAINFLSSIFVKIKDVGYGTRTHSIILVDEECNIEFIEHTLKDPIDPEEPNPNWDITLIKAHL